LFNQRNNVRRLFRVAKKLRGNESGVTLLETLVALAILGLVAVVFLNGLTTAAQATIIADKQATAESLVRSQMEYVKSQPYINYADSATEYPSAPIPSGKDYSGYSVIIAAEPIDPDTGLPLLSGDDGVQKITVTVKHRNKLVLTIEDYKVDRLEGE